MHRDGSGSWRFEHDNSQYLHLALFVRDAVRLPVPSSADIPPRLAGDLPDYADVLPPGGRAAAGQQWIVWWRRLLGQAVGAPDQRAIQDAERDVRERFARRDDVFDPPDFGSLADMQPLQSTAISTFEIAVQWSNSQRGGQGEPERFPWPLVRDVAENTAADLGIPVSDLNAVVHVFDVAGLWSYLGGPGCALCSAAVATDPSAGRRLLHDTFGSGPGHEAALVR